MGKSNTLTKAQLEVALKLTKDDCMKLFDENRKMRGWLERIYKSQNWSDLGDFLKELDSE